MTEQERFAALRREALIHRGQLLALTIIVKRMAATLPVAQAMDLLENLGAETGPRHPAGDDAEQAFMNDGISEVYQSVYDEIHKAAEERGKKRRGET